MSGRRPASPRRRRRRGTSTVDALVAATLAAVALAGLAASAALGARQLRDVRRASLASALAVDALERLRPAPRAAGDDRIEREGLSFERAWEVVDGRGRPSTLRARVRSGAHATRLDGAVAP